MRQRGDPIHGEIIHTEVGAGVEFTLYPNGSLTALILAANQRVRVTDLIISTDLANVVKVTADDNAAGERIAYVRLPVNGTARLHLRTPHVCPAGVTPKVVNIGPAKVTVLLQGTIVEV